MPRLGFTLVALSLTACIPWPRHATKVPALEVSVSDADGGALPEAEVTLVRFSYPHAVVHESTTRAVDGGVTSFEEVREWETIWPLMPHGIPFYDFAWCVDAPAHDARVGLVKPDMKTLAVALEAGDAGCPSAKDTVTRARFSR